jgi:valyl-tRNA synthetase
LSTSVGATELVSGLGSQQNALKRGQVPEKVWLYRDEDVLDTWFSSALWPFSTLGWPDDTPELKRFYKTDVLVTAFDIIFFWVARMMMMGLHFMKDEDGRPEVPFHTVYIHALVRDDKGQKMSKSKGNVIDPLELIDQHGADALRFTLAAMAAQGRDIKLSAGRVEGYRNFATKLWNAARFIQMNGCARAEGFDPSRLEETVNRWIVGEATRAAMAVTEAIEAYKFNEAAGAIYHFLWHVYCDWYVELIKPVLAGEGAAAAETRATAAFALDEALKLLHPFMPFITEELWDRLGESGPARESLLVTAPWPDGLREGDSQADDEIGWLIGLISEIRSVRAEMNVPAGARVPVIVRDAAPATEQRLARHREIISRLARLSGFTQGGKVPAGAIQIVHGEATVALPLADVVDLGAERDRLARELGRIDQEIAKIDGKLGNDQFMARAPAHVVDEQRERRADASGQRARLESALERLSAAI